MFVASSPGSAPNSRVLRGGSFNNNATNMRSANRNNNRPGNRNNNNGFRVSSTLTVVCKDHQARIQQRDLKFQISCWSVPLCKVQVFVLCRSRFGCTGQIINPPGRSGRSSGFERPAGHVLTIQPLFVNAMSLILRCIKPVYTSAAANSSLPPSEQIFQGMAHIDAAGRPAAE